MPDSKIARACILQLDEDTGEIQLSLPEYGQEEYLTFGSLLFDELAYRIANDKEWSEKLVSDAEERAMSSTVH